LQSRIRAARNRPLSERQKSANTTRSKVRARVEHVFGHQQSSMGGKIVRTIGIVLLCGQAIAHRATANNAAPPSVLPPAVKETNPLCPLHFF
jgi:hypothetical protein